VERRLRYPEPFELKRASAYLDGFSLHAGVRVHEHDRDGLERLCRYIARPPFALDRLGEGEGGRLTYRMKRPRGGSRWLALEPAEPLGKIATLVPPPGVHAVRYHGVFAPNAKGRARVVPARERPVLSRPEVPRPGDAAVERRVSPVATPGRCAANPSADAADKRGGAAACYRVPWAELLQKVFAVDVLECPDCGGRLRVLACVTEAAAVKRLLAHLGIDATGPPVARAAAGPESAGDPLPEYDLVDPTPEE
jgi:hypothetical protein